MPASIKSSTFLCADSNDFTSRRNEASDWQASFKENTSAIRLQLQGLLQKFVNLLLALRGHKNSD